MASRNSGSVYLGIKGSVVALDRRTGQERWRTSLKGRDFVNVALDGDLLIATVRGEAFCLDPDTGRIRWANPLKGLGLGLVTIAGTGIASLAQQRAADAAAAASSAAAVSAATV